MKKNAARTANMHILIQDPGAISAALYRRFARRAQLQGLLPDQVVDGEPYLALNALVLDAADHALLARLTETFAAAFQKAGERLAADVPGLVEMGFPWLAAELLAAEPPRRPLVGRLDFVRDEDGRWWLLELNADTPSGVREAIVADELAHALLPTDGLARPGAALAPSLIAAFRAALAGAPRGRALGLVTTTSMLEDLAQMAFTRELLAGPLGERGIEVVLGDLDNLAATRRGLTLCGRPLGALYRYVPFEGMLGSPAFAAIYEAVAAGHLALLNGLYGLLLQHKGVMSWLWAHRDDERLGDEERAAIRRHLPPTWPIDAYPEEEAQASLVAKQVFGREGEEVFFGEDLAPEAWTALVRRRTYVAQRRVRVVELAGAVPTSVGFERRSGHASVGCFAVDGRWAGYYTRFGGKVITSRAKCLATFVDRPSSVLLQ